MQGVYKLFYIVKYNNDEKLSYYECEKIPLLAYLLNQHYFYVSWSKHSRYYVLNIIYFLLCLAVLFIYLDRIIFFCFFKSEYRQCFSFQILFPLVGFATLANNAQEITILEYAKTEDVHVQKSSHLQILRVKKVMVSRFEFLFLKTLC